MDRRRFLKNGGLIALLPGQPHMELNHGAYREGY